MVTFHRIPMGGQRRHQRVPGLVDGHGPLLLRQQDVGVLPPPEQNPVAGVGEVHRREYVPAGPDRENRRLVDQVGQIRPGEPGRPSGHDVQVDVGTELLALGVDLEDGAAFLLGGQGDDHLPIKPARAQQRRIQGFGAVGGRHHHHPGGRIEAVQLGQQLVQGLVALVVGDELAPPALADGVDFVDEHDRGGALAGLVEQIPDPGRPYPHEHLHKRGPGHGNERDMGLPGHGPGQQGLAGPGRADHQDPLGADGPGPGVAVGVLEEVDDLGDLPLGPRVAGHIGKGRGWFLGVIDPGLGAADAAQVGQLAAGAPAQVDKEGDQQHKGQEAGQRTPTHELCGPTALTWTFFSSRSLVNASSRRLVGYEDRKRVPSLSLPSMWPSEPIWIDCT
jgi:hypothetical protein